MAEGAVRADGTGMLLDTSCYHAAFGNLLMMADPTAHVTVILGGNASTSACLPGDGYLFFGDPVPRFVELLESAGYHIPHGRLSISDPTRDLAELLRGRRMLAVSLDAFHVTHFRTAYQQLHMPHLVLLADLDPEDGTIHLLDGVEPTVFSGRVGLRELDAALRDDQGAKWVAVDCGTQGAPRPVGIPSSCADELFGSGGRWLSGMELLTVLGQTLSEHAALVRGLATPPLGANGMPDTGRGGNILRGLGMYHSNLRWLARALAGIPGIPGIPGISAAYDCVARAAREVLIVRALMMRTRSGGPDQAKLGRRLADHVERALTELRVAAESTAFRNPDIPGSGAT